MTRSFAAALRRANRLMRPVKQSKASQSLHKSMTDLMVDVAFAPFVTSKTKPDKRRKAALPKTGRRLGTVLKQLKVTSTPLPRAKAEVPNLPSGAQYLTRQHRSTAGSRGYRLYLPASQPVRPKGLILMLHGCNQSPDDFALGTHMNAMAEKHGLAVAYPCQTKGHNAGSCWNWFKPGHQTRGMGEPAILASLTRKLMRDFGLERGSVFVAGLSAGGAMAAILADVYPDIFSAAGVHSGLARGSARDVLSAMSAMRSGGTSADITADPAKHGHQVRRIVFHGETDSTVHPSNAALIVAAVMGGGTLPSRVGNRSVRGHSYARSDYAGADGAVQLELWMIEQTGHAWSGGRAAGSFTERKGPDASAQMIRFFLTPPD